jgi:3-keto-disaccharide hydrolase
MRFLARLLVVSSLGLAVEAPAQAPADVIDFSARDDAMAAAVDADGVRVQAGRVVVHLPSGALSSDEGRALAEKLNRGLDALEAFTHAPHAWQRPLAELHYYFHPTLFVSHADAPNDRLFISLPRLKNGEAPILHEAVHVLLYPSKEFLAAHLELDDHDAPSPTWLFEGVADYVAFTVAAQTGIVEGDVLNTGGVEAADANCAKALAQPVGAEIAPFIGGVGEPEGLSLRSRRLELAPPFYECAASLTKYLIDAHGIDAVIDLIVASDHAAALQELAGLDVAALRAAWRKAIGAPLDAAGPLGRDAPAASREDWQPLFNGVDLTGWIPKIRRHPPGENYARTFRVENGLLTVSYADYTDFAEQFGHLFYQDPFSHYRLRVEYRFVGEPMRDTPTWAIRNSGAMVHAQSPWTMPPDQDFPISIEVQLLGGLGDGKPRPTGNVCSPGTHIVFRGALTQTHCIESSSPTFDGDQWVLSETLVLGSERVVHFINGEAVVEYGGMVTGGGVVSGYRPEYKPEGRLLGAGYIALQSEGHPVQFRRVELLNLKGCADPVAANYKRYYVEAANETCRY